MPYARPTLTQLIAQTAADVRAALPTADPLLRRAVLTVLSRVLAGQHHEQFGYLDWIARQAVPFTATGENLAGWAALRGLAASPATYGSVTALSSGNNPNTAVAPGASLLRSDGTSYTASGGGAVDANGNITLAVSAVTAGSASNVAIGAGLVLSSPASGVNSNFAVTAIIANGTDLETDDSLRSRLLAAFANPVQGGDLADYVQWASAVGGVTRAWVANSLAGTGTVTVYFMMDNVRSYQYGLPAGQNGVSAAEPRAPAATGDQLVVANALYAKRAATALVYACAPVGRPLQIILQEVPNDPTIRGNISAAIAGLCIRLATPGGVWLQPTQNGVNGARGGILRRSDIEDAIAAVPNLSYFLLVSPTGDVVSPTGVIPIPAAPIYL
jgi:uncharacterized phage protein gp47/JayE